MKYRNKLFVLSVLFLLSCNNTGDISSNYNSELTSDLSSEEKSEIVSSEDISLEEIVFNKEYIINYLNNASKTSYQIDYVQNGRQVFDVFKDNYLYVSSTNKGYIELNSFDSLYGETIVYNYYLDNERVTLGACLTTTNSIGKVVPVKEIENLNYFSLWDESKFKEDKLINAGELGIFTEDQEMISVLAGVLGYYSASTQGAFEKAFFNNKQNGLEIALEISDDYVSTLDDEMIYGTISNVGKASVNCIDDFLSSFKVSEEKLDESSLDRITGNNIHLKAKMKFIENDVETNSSYELEVKMDKLHIFTSILENNRYSSSMIEKAINDDESGKFVKGDSISSFIDGTNSVVSYSNGIKFSEYDFPSSYKNDVLNSFRKVDENKYHYFGFNENNYITSLLRSIPGNGSEMVSSIDVELINNKVSKMYVDYQKSGRFIDNNSEPIFSYYRCEIEFFDLSSPIEGITPYEEIENETDLIKDAFDTLKSGSTYYHAEGYDVDEKKINQIDYDVDEIYVTENTILLNERKFGVLNNIKGWHKKDGKIIPFVIQKDKNNNLSIVAIKESEEKDLSSYIPWNASENVFKFDENNDIVVRKNVINIHPYIYVGPYAPSMVLSTFKMKTDEQNRITKITYDCDNVTSSSKEQVDIDYENYSIPEEYQTLIDGLEEFKTPSSWEEESSIISERIKYFLGEENINKLPYLYDEKNFGIRTASIIDDINTGLAKYLHIYTSVLSLPSDYNFYNSSFVDNYKVLLESLGFVKQTNMVAPHNGTMYLLDNLLIEVCVKDVDGIYVSKV